MFMSKRALLAAPLAVVLAGSVWSGTALAQDPAPPDEEAGLAAQLCAAADIGEINALLGANLDVGLPAGVRDAVNPSIAGGSLDEVRSTLNCGATDPPDDGTEPGDGTDDPGDDNTGAGTDVPPTEPQFDSCVDAIAAGSIQPATRGVDDSYQANLDADGDGVSCEADETSGGPAPGTGDSGSGSGSGDDGSGTLGGDDSTGGSGSVDSIPRGSVDTGYAPR